MLCIELFLKHCGGNKDNHHPWQHKWGMLSKTHVKAWTENVFDIFRDRTGIHTNQIMV